MNARKRLIHVTAAIGLCCGALVAAAPAVQASVPSCQTAFMGVLDADGSLVKRTITNTTVDSERKTAASLGVVVTNLMWFNSVKVIGGKVNHIETLANGSKPLRFSVRDIDTAPNLTTTPGPSYSHTFSKRLVTGSGRYYVYGVGSDGNLNRWTRYADQNNQYYYSSLKVVAHNMSGLRTLSYSYSYQLNGKVYDYLYATTASGALKQFQIPWSSPSSKTMRNLATTGFATATGLSLSFCNDNVDYLSVIAINGTADEARWYTFAGVIHQSGGPLAYRGLVQPDADWHVHATT